MDNRPIVGITMGDPAGNGPELSVKALADPKVYEKCRPIVIGDANCIEAAIKIVGRGGQLKVNGVKEVKDALFQPGTIDVYDMEMVDIEKRVYGKVSAMCG